MSAVHQQQTPPTAEHPELGQVVLCGVVISSAYHWVDDGEHILRSAEFDVIAGDLDLSVAVNKFIENAEDLAEGVSELDPDDRTKSEVEYGVQLLQRFTAAYRKAAEKHRPRRIEIGIGPRRAGHPRGGFTLSAPQTSSQRQLV